LISQVINLSKRKSFKLYQEKFNCSIPFYEGLYGVEVRNVPKDIINEVNNSNSQKIYCKYDTIFLAGSQKAILDQTRSSKLNQKIKLKIEKSIENFNLSDTFSYQIGDRQFNFNQAFVMGILNVTPDSFSDGGKYSQKDKAVSHALRMIDEGADIIDIGGESTRPGSNSVSEAEELDRVVPIISEILKQQPNAIVSIDSTKAKIAREALRCGAMIVNDISGGTFEPQILDVVKEFKAAIVIMHIKGKPKTMQQNPNYNEVVSEVYDYLTAQTEIASKKGIDNIFIDPGIGFGKRVEDNLSLIERLDDFKSMGFPILIGLSRKSFIGNILNLPVEDRDDVTNALNLFAISKGARIIRTHNVKQAVQTCKIYNSMISN